ncbi:hypothetical protein GH714_027857 [Hevea brasiliensis]|uniref:Uncharacterized protein n=1 Tax=Hevea brasiliensis TaxID=3981 RepID=A0A6A6MI62_HEVBR|nr:hypothetical protein GH714_027857 [Hevea brasiliensis]
MNIGKMSMEFDYVASGHYANVIYPFAAFCQGRTCIGSGVICERALGLARMEDKSKIGKPVKIKVKPEIPASGKDGIELNRQLADSQVAVIS